MSDKKGRIYGANVNIDLQHCFYCGTDVDEFSRTKDHIIPESRGGIRANKNSLPSCGDCNRLKADMTPEEFLRAIKSMIQYEKKTHKSRYGYLSRIQKNLKRLIQSKDGKNT
jgi:5-methylcytosine-specific restriction endonuclease McrA